MSTDALNRKHAGRPRRRRRLPGYPLSLAGTALLAVSLYLLVRSFLTGSPYELILSLFGLAALLLLLAGSRLRMLRLGRLHFEWDAGRPAMAGPGGCEQRLLAPALRSGVFFRLHFRVGGRLAAGRGASLRVSAETSTATGGVVPLRLFFPLCGEYAARSQLVVKDIFGLTRAVLGDREEERRLVVLPAPLARSEVYPVEAVGGFEDKSTRKSSDEERYFMREYMPGDRFRDINWKASSRLAQLVTRISPYSQEKTRVIPILLRHFREPGPETVESLVHLNVLKSWLLSFLRQVKREHPDYHFAVWTGLGQERLETEEEIERFALALSALFFQQDPFDVPSGAGWEELYIFTTPYDHHLPTVLAQLPPGVPRIFRTRAAGAAEKDAYRYALLDSLESLFLPGAWILRRERRLPTPALGAALHGRTLETPVTVEVMNA